MTLQGEAAPEVHALATLVHLGRRARQAQDKAELCFIAVNETHMLAPYRQAALWLVDQGVVALSGVVSVEANAPYVQWLGGVLRHLAAGGLAGEPRVVRPEDLREADVAEWGDWLPPEALWLPLSPVGRHFAGGALLLVRDEPWTPGEAGLLGEWAPQWAQSCALHERHPLRHLWSVFGSTSGQADPRPPGTRIRAWMSRPKAWILAGLVMLAVLPVKLTVLAPADLIPLNPAVIRSPIDGVIDRIAVVPNQRVKADQRLLDFDRTTIRNRLLVAERVLETARMEYRQRAQIALSDAPSMAQLAVLQGQIVEKTIEVNFLRDLDGRSTVLAPRDGIVLFDDPSEWIGRPVVTGERVMVVADEGDVEVEAWLSPANAIDLDDGAPVTLYLNADPLSPLDATLRYVAHEAIQRPDGQYAYRVRATLVGNDDRARAGLKGTAKLEGGRVPLLYWVLRRPLADARAWLGV